MVTSDFFSQQQLARESACARLDSGEGTGRLTTGVLAARVLEEGLDLLNFGGLIGRGTARVARECQNPSLGKKAVGMTAEWTLRCC
jgi:hypothetical protein